MANKLKTVFSNSKVDGVGSIRSHDSESQKALMEGIRAAYKESGGVEIQGKFLLTIGLEDGDLKYPLVQQQEVAEIKIAQPSEDASVKLETKYGQKELLLKQSRKGSETIFETDENELLYCKVTTITATKEETLTVKVQQKFAKTVKELVEAYSFFSALIDKLLKEEKPSEEYSRLVNKKRDAQEAELFFERIYQVEQELGVNFNPARHVETIGSDEEIFYEIYILLVEKKAIRLNAKLNSTESTSLTIQEGMEKLEVGHAVTITFLQEVEYIIFGEKISVHTVSLLSNAIIKEFKEEEDAVKALYGDTDSSPMYISYTGFKTLNEAEQEMKNIMKHKKRYTEALTLEEHMQSL